MQYDFIIRGGLVVSGEGIRRADVAVDGEQVAAVEPEVAADAARVIDATGKLVLPGIIDPHVHPVYLDDIGWLSQVAAYGGTTTLLHFVSVYPEMGLVETLRRFREDGERGSVLDFGLHGALFDPAHQIPEIPQALEMGVASFKLFMTYARLGWMTDDYHLLWAMDTVAQHGGLVMVHAENGLATDYLESKLEQEGQDPRRAYLASRPGVLEAEGAQRAITLAGVAGCPLYIVHLSTAETVAVAARARTTGQRIYTETCPQYLTLTREEVFRQGALVKIGPPLRSAEDNAALWKALREGVIDTIGSDHAPKDKHRDDDFATAPYGSPQAETMLTVVYDAGVNRGLISLPRLVQVMCENPARIFGLYPRKGILAPGSDADLVVFDPTLSHTITQATQHTRAPYTPYEGRRCLGKPVFSMQRGRVLLENGKLHASPGQGQFLERGGPKGL